MSDDHHRLAFGGPLEVLEKQHFSLGIHRAGRLIQQQQLRTGNQAACQRNQLALPTGMAAVMAKESLAPQLKEFIGTGPYKLKERRPDQFTVLVRHEGYSARSEPARSTTAAATL